MEETVVQRASDRVGKEEDSGTEEPIVPYKVEVLGQGHRPLSP